MPLTGQWGQDTPRSTSSCLPGQQWPLQPDERVLTASQWHRETGLPLPSSCHGVPERPQEKEGGTGDKSPGLPGHGAARGNHRTGKAEEQEEGTKLKTMSSQRSAELNPSTLPADLALNV